MKVIVLVLSCVALCSCAVQTPQTRIVKYPHLYNSLSTKHQELVKQGQIAEGMPSAGVILAYGNPNRRSHGRRAGKDFQRWDYTSLRPITRNHFSYGYGRGFGRYGRFHRRHGFGFGHSIDYVPYLTRSVWFHGDRVDSWESNTFPY